MKLEERISTVSTLAPVALCKKMQYRPVQCSHFPPVWGGKIGFGGAGSEARFPKILAQTSIIRSKSLRNHKETCVNNEKRSIFSSGRLTAAENLLKPLICLMPQKSCPPTFQPRMETLLSSHKKSCFEPVWGNAYFTKIFGF